MRASFLPLRATVCFFGVLALIFPLPEAEAAGANRPEISFTVLRLKEQNVEGPDVERTYFTAGGKRIVFGLPKDCRLTNDGGGFLLQLREAKLDGEIHIERSPFTPELDLAQNALQYRESAAKDTPRGATGVEVQQPVLNPYPYNGWKSLGFTWTYVIGGRPMTRTVSYINLEVGVQVMVTTLAAKNDAKKVGEMAQQFMSSWWVLDK